MTKPWKAQALNVMQNYLNELEQDLPPGSTIDDIERKLWNSQQALFQETLRIRASSESFPPPKIEHCVRDGRRTMPIKTMYVTIHTVTQTYQQTNRTHFQRTLDPSLDHSGTTPLLLEQLIDLSARMPFAEGSELAKRWQVNICPAELERLTAPVAHSGQ